MRDQPDPHHGSREGRETAGGSAKERGPQTQSGPCPWCSYCFGITGLSPAAWGELSLGESQRGPVDVLGEPGWSLEAALTSGNQGETMGGLSALPLVGGTSDKWGRGTSHGHEDLGLGRRSTRILLEIPRQN